MWPLILAWLRSRWQIVAGWAVGAAGLAIALWSIRKGGRDAERAAGQQRTLEAVRERDDIKTDVDSLSTDDLDKRLHPWLRD